MPIFIRNLCLWPRKVFISFKTSILPTKTPIYRYAEAEAALLHKSDNQINNLDDITTEYGEQASFALSLLGKIAIKTERKSRAADAWKRALKLNPYQWSSFENLCKLGDKPNPQTVFQISGVENLSMCHGTNLNNIESVIIPSASPNVENQESYITTPQPVLANFNTTNNSSLSGSKLCTPDVSPLCQQPLWLSGFVPLTARIKPRFRLDSGNVSICSASRKTNLCSFFY